VFHCAALTCLAPLAQTLPEAGTIIQDHHNDSPFANDALLTTTPSTTTTSLTAVTLSAARCTHTPSNPAITSTRTPAVAQSRPESRPYPHLPA
jgi:hypothetical protein